MAKTPGKKGPPEHQKTAQNVKTVVAWASVGIPQTEIATYLGISAPTLRKHYAQELATAASRANAQTGQSLFQMANGRPAEYERDENGKLVFDPNGNPILLREELVPHPASAMFWMKCRAGWREKQEVVVRQPDVAGNAALTQAQARDMLANMDSTERRAFKNVLDAMKNAKTVPFTEVKD